MSGCAFPLGFSTLQLPFSSLQDECCIPYLDDVLCYSKTFEEHVYSLRRVLRVLQLHGVKLRPAKCKLFRKEGRYEGRLVSADGVRIDTKDIEAIQALKDKVPTTVGEVQKLLGFLSHDRTYIQDFSGTAKPIHELLQSKNTATALPQPRPKRGKGAQLSSRTLIQWMEEHQRSVNQHLISSTSSGLPRLRFPLCATHRRVRARSGGSAVPAAGREAPGHLIWVQNSYTC